MPKKQETAQAPRRLVVAITSGSVSTKNSPMGIDFHAGDFLPADAEIVRLAPKFFMPADSTASELAAARSALMDWTPAGTPPPPRQPDVYGWKQ
jgi:hypothetical protein